MTAVCLVVRQLTGHPVRSLDDLLAELVTEREIGE
jgi:hypothetical protein